MSSTRLPWPAPDFAGDCLTQVLPSALAVLMRERPSLPLPAADRVVIVLVDGLGHHQLPLASQETPFLSAMSALLPDGIDVVFPSTTAASLTSFGTGLPPGLHGIVGASFWLPELDNLLYPLGWRDRPTPQAVQPEQTVFEQARALDIAVTSVAAREFERSGLTVSALRRGRYVGADSPGELVVAIATAAAVAPPALVYGYISAVDKSGHIHGVGSQQWRLDLQHTDRTIEQLAQRLPSGTLLLVTGDHGMINCPDASRVNIDGSPFMDGVRRIAGEPRMRHVYVRPDSPAAVVAERWTALLGEDALVLTSEAAISSGLFGEVAYGIADRIGDVLALPTGDRALVSDRFDSIVSGLRGQHGGLTAQERRVPLLGWVA